MSNQTKFRFSIDRGGTFTDIYAEIPVEPGFMTIKLLSEDPDHYADGPSEGIRRIIEAVQGESLTQHGIDSSTIEWIRMGTTVATNALLERKGERVALVATKGFGDMLRIGYQNRPKLFDLAIQKPDVLYESVVEVDERVRVVSQYQTSEKHANLYEGLTGEIIEVLKAPNEADVEAALLVPYRQGIRSIAVTLMHGYAFSGHEIMVGRIAQKIGFQHISLSHQIMPRIRIVGRGDTTTADAYLTPHITRYVESFKAGFSDNLKGTKVFFMQSYGGLTDAKGFHGSNALLSGPAGGVVGYAMTAFHQHGKPAIGFDMGGTSTDVSRYAGEYELTHESETGGVRIQAPQLHIVTVAAGGGSKLFYQNGRFIVGPESVGAHPGPVCYRKHGQLAITDANLVLGRICPDFFPKVFGADSQQPLDDNLAREAFELLCLTINRDLIEQGKEAMSLESVALGFIQVANETMARPIREISIARGYDIQNHILACFGGAGGQHACAIAKNLGIKHATIHRFAGILSAYGIGLADIVKEKQLPAAYRYDDSIHETIEPLFRNLENQASAELRQEGFSEQQIHIVRYLNLRYEKTVTPIMIPCPHDNDYRRAFRQFHLNEYGFDFEEDRRVIVDDLRIRGIGKTAPIRQRPIEPATSPPIAEKETSVYFESGWRKTPIYLIERLKAGHRIEGPALIIQDASTIVIEPNCSAEIAQDGNIDIAIMKQASAVLTEEADPVQLSIFNNLFMSIAEQMGRTLQRIALSTNIKERLDFSCALFDKQGNLVANAPHIPVHLGSMSEAVKAQIALLGDTLQEGDVILTNAPTLGGTHLPDMTVITPVFKDNEIIFFTASRGHHADIGGISPGSIPPFSQSLAEEGVCFKSFKLVSQGRLNEQSLIEALAAPTRLFTPQGVRLIVGCRNVKDNLSDLKAQIAANKKGVELILDMIDYYGLSVVQAYMAHIQNNAESAVREMICRISAGLNLQEVDVLKAEDSLDDGSPICLTLTINRKRATMRFDFTGTAPELEGNLNAPRSVTFSAILYVLRCLVNRDIPLNAGCLTPIEIIIPKGSLLAPSEQAAVVAGNVETSCRIVDVALKALQASAGSQGTVNNFTFGNETFGYYETICGGSGAGPSWHGQSAVHTHMTNTRITDPEILERRYPVILREFSIRKGSGGKGRFHGGDGAVREIEFLQPMNAAILSERRRFAPYGLEQGQPGQTGKNFLIKTSGDVIDLGGKNEVAVERGDRIRIETPGGGGFGAAQDSKR